MLESDAATVKDVVHVYDAARRFRRARRDERFETTVKSLIDDSSTLRELASVVWRAASSLAVAGVLAVISNETATLVVSLLVGSGVGDGQS